MANFDRRDDALAAVRRAIRGMPGIEREIAEAFVARADDFVERDGPGPGWGNDSAPPGWQLHGLVTSFQEGTPRATYWAVRNDRLELFDQFMTTFKAVFATATSTVVVPILGPFAGLIIPAGTLVAMFFSLMEIVHAARAFGIRLTLREFQVMTTLKLLAAPASDETLRLVLNGIRQDGPEAWTQADMSATLQGLATKRRRNNEVEALVAQDAAGLWRLLGGV